MLEKTLIYRVDLWRALECNGVLWSAMECFGVQWSALECIGVRWSAELSQLGSPIVRSLRVQNVSAGSLKLMHAGSPFGRQKIIFFSHFHRGGLVCGEREGGSPPAPRKEWKSSVLSLECNGVLWRAAISKKL